MMNPLGYLQYFIFLAPALILAAIAQMWVRSAYARGQSVATNLTGFLAARRILDAAGLQSVAIEEVPGQLSDHYRSARQSAAAIQRQLSRPQSGGGGNRRA